MKGIKVVGIAIACIILICGGFYLYSQSLDSGNPDQLTELEK